MSRKTRNSQLATPGAPFLPTCAVYVPDNTAIVTSPFIRPRFQRPYSLPLAVDSPW